MLKKILIGILMSSSLFSQNFVTNFFKYSTAYSSFSLNAPRYQDDRFAIIGGLSTGQLEVSRDKRELKPDFQTAGTIHYLGPHRIVISFNIFLTFSCFQNPKLIFFHDSILSLDSFNCLIYFITTTIHYLGPLLISIFFSLSRDFKKHEIL